MDHTCSPHTRVRAARATRGKSQSDTTRADLQNYLHHSACSRTTQVDEHVARLLVLHHHLAAPGEAHRLKGCLGPAVDVVDLHADLREGAAVLDELVQRLHALERVAARAAHARPAEVVPVERQLLEMPRIVECLSWERERA